MNNKIIIPALIIIFLCQLYVIGQPYQPIPDSNATWIIQEGDGYGGHYFNKFSLSPTKNDTIIDSITYTKLFHKFENGNTRYHGAFRNGENGKSYWLQKNSQEEYLLRDFTKNTGDTIKNVSYEFLWTLTWVLDFYVESVEYVTNGPYTFKVMYLRTVVEDTIPNVDPDDVLVWMEKIGSFGGGILNSRMAALGAHRLYCMQYNDTIYYDSYLWWFRPEDITYDSGICPYPVGVNEQDLDKTRLLITPNPFDNQITLHNLPPNYAIELSIFDQLGQLVFNKELIKGRPIQKIKIWPSLHPGFYILKIQSANKLLFTQKIIKR